MLGTAAQHYGNGVGFNYSDISNIICRYDSSVLTSLWTDTGRTTQVASDADAAKAWDDLSGNARHMTDSTGCVYKTNIVNGRPVVRATRASNNKLAASFTLSLPVHVLAVFRQRTAGTANETIFDGAAGTNTMRLFAPDGRYNYLYSGGYGAEISECLDWQMMDCWFHASAASINGRKTYGALSGTPNGFQINKDTIGCDVDYAEIILTSTRVTGSTLLKLRQFWNAKWGTLV